MLFPPAVFLVIAQGVDVAGKAQAVMTAYLPTAFFALPPLILLDHERINTVLLNGFEIFNHAHVVFRTIAFVQHFKAPTGKIGAFKAKADTPVPKQFTAITHMQTVFAASYAALAILPVEALFFKV